MICVRATDLHQNTLHSLDPTSAEMSDLGVIGWFPILHSDSGRLVFLRTRRMGDPDRIILASLVGGALVDEIVVEPNGEWYGPPLFWSDSKRVFLAVEPSGGTYVELDVDTGRLGPQMSFGGGSPLSVAAVDDDRWYLVRSADRRALCWANRDGKVTTQVADGGSISADFDHVNWMVAMLDQESDSLSWFTVDGDEIGNIDVASVRSNGQWDWWRPIRHEDGWTAISAGLDIVLIDQNGNIEGIPNAIHASIGERPKEVRREAEPSKIFAPQPVSQPIAQSAPQPAPQPVAQSSPEVVGSVGNRFPLMRTWTRGVPIMVCAGGAWNALGGGQRPNAIARELVKMGHPTYYFSIGQQSGGISGGIAVMGPKDLWDVTSMLTKSPGVLFVGLPLYLDHLGPLIDAGWTLIYDMLDNWSGFVKSEGLDPRNIELEEEIIRRADMVTCSDPRLCERAEEMGAPATVLVRNGGPSTLQPRNVPPRDMASDARHLVAYAGHIHGSWFDWDLMKEIDRHDDLATTVVGGWIQERYERTRFIGERDYPEVIRYLAASDVGIIPFCNPEITRYVDPVKAYDYWSAGTWCVCTPELESMVDRPYTIVADRENFVDAIREAAEMRNVDPPTAEWVQDNSWASRARQIVDVVRQFHPDPNRTAIHVRPNAFVDPDRTGLRVTIQSPSTCNMYPPCPYCGSHGHWGQDVWSRPAGEWLDALTRFFDEHAPVFSSACLGETLSDKDSLFIWREIARGHRIELVTNLLFKTKFLDPLPRNGNVVLVTSFHPHKMTIDEFISRRQAVIDSGLDVGRVLVVGFPPNMPMVEEWNDRFSDLGWQMELIPYRGMDDGKVYPEAYRGDDRDTIERYLKAVHGRSDLLYGSPCGKRCVAGNRYCCIKWDGDVFGCSTSLFAPRLGNIFSGDPIRLLPDPVVCDSDSCHCPDLWQFLLDGGEME